MLTALSFALLFAVGLAEHRRFGGDAFVAAELAEAGARGAAELVVINLDGRDDPRVSLARDLAAIRATRPR